eukprot:9466741-Pyramimonas_sp.AAC.1
MALTEATGGMMVDESAALAGAKRSAEDIPAAPPRYQNIQGRCRWGKTTSDAEYLLEGDCVRLSRLSLRMNSRTLGQTR